MTGSERTQWAQIDGLFFHSRGQRDPRAGSGHEYGAVADTGEGLSALGKPGERPDCVDEPEGSATLHSFRPSLEPAGGAVIGRSSSDLF